MNPTTTLFEVFDNKCSYQHFAKAGDELSLHVHDFAHATFALKGDFDVFNDKGDVVELKQFSYVVFPAGKYHGIRAKNDESLLMTINE